AFGQKKAKPKLLVYGQGEAAFAAAIQASASGVSTLWVLPEAELRTGLEQPLGASEGAPVSGRGLWSEFLRASQNASEMNGSVLNRAASLLNPQLARSTLSKMIDSSITFNKTINRESYNKKSLIDLPYEHLKQFFSDKLPEMEFIKEFGQNFRDTDFDNT